MNECTWKQNIARHMMEKNRNHVTEVRAMKKFCTLSSPKDTCLERNSAISRHLSIVYNSQKLKPEYRQYRFISKAKENSISRILNSNSFPGSSRENKVAFHGFIHHVAGALLRFVVLQNIDKLYKFGCILVSRHFPTRFGCYRR